MITIHVPRASYFDENKLEFVDFPERTVHMEHSLYAISKWEEKWHKPFLTNLPSFQKTQEEALDYMRCMCKEDDEEELNPLMFANIPKDEYDKLQAYMKDDHSATHVKKKEGAKHSNEITTSELIYYAMFGNQIPKECEHWHINRLLKLIEVFAAKQEKPKKMPKSAMLSQRRALSKARGYK